ncbi:CAP family protein [Amycolatopsis sp. NPDC059657]|uniref:CAP family protein n=1 Tax=Amycolatopsis sp. NPDC059657 TaxID=3346899 RepID=UPI003673409D
MMTIAVALCAAAPAAQAADPVGAAVTAANNYRARHHVPPLRLDPSVSRVAQDWAAQLQSRGGLQHRPDTQYGENLFWGSSGSESVERVARLAVDSWYGEGRGYNYAQDYTGSNGALHFTALVWKSSTRVGVGISQGRNGTYVVVNFAPAGNVVGEFRANVLPPR